MDIKNGLVRGFLKVIGGLWATRIDTQELTAERIEGKEINEIKSGISGLQAVTAQLNSHKANTGHYSTPNLNTLNNGIYIIQTEAQYGLPTGWYQIIVTRPDNTTGIQTAFDLWTGAHYNRYLASGTWSTFSCPNPLIGIKDVNITITTANWITSAKGQKYFNSSNFLSLGISGIVIGCFISSWSGTHHLVTCSPYQNAYIQFRAEIATDWVGTVRIIYI